MRKRKFKNSLKIGILIIGVLLTFTNCEKEQVFDNSVNDTNIEPTDQQQGIKLSVIGYDELKDNPKIIHKIEKFKKYKSNVQAKGVYNEIYDITIETNKVKYIENGDYHSYTFPIKQGIDENIVNVLFTLNDNNDYDAFLVTYDYSTEQLNTLAFTELSKITKMTPIDLDFNSLASKMKSSWVCVYSYEYVKTGSEFVNVGDSQLFQDVYEWVLIAQSCHAVTYELEDNTIYNSGIATITLSGTNSGGGGTLTSPTQPTPYEEEELIKLNVVKDELNLNFLQRDWVDKNGETAFEFHDFLVANLFNEVTKNFAKGQIELETKIWYTNKDNKWTPQNGKLKGRDDLKYTKVYHTVTESHYLMEDGSYVISSGTELTLNSDGALARKATSELFPNESYWYIKHPDVGEWANFLFSENNLADEVELLLNLGAQEFAKSIGKYALPIEEFKVLFTGTDFNGNQVNQYYNTGILLVSIVPGGKLLKVAGNAAEASIVVLKLGKSPLVVDTVKTGLKIVADNNVIKFLSQTGDEIARIVNGIMTFKYTGFGGSIITNPNKTTTILGRYVDNIGKGTKSILDSKLFKFGENKGGFNLLDEPTWGNLTQNQKDLLNHNWLEQAFQRGDDIRLISDQTNKFSNGILTQYGKELNWIDNFVNTYNYSYNSMTKTYIKN